MLLTVNQRIGPLDSVDNALAFDEGEDDRTRDSRRREHTRYFRRVSIADSQSPTANSGPPNRGSSPNGSRRPGPAARPLTGITGRRSRPLPWAGTAAGVAQWQSPSLPSWPCGFDSRHPLHAFTQVNLSVRPS